MITLKANKDNLYRGTVGAAHRAASDLVMEQTWNNDPAAKVCYLYDIFHDDSPDLNSGMSYVRTKKTKIDARYIVTQHGSLSKDQVEYHVMFKPSVELEFSNEFLPYYIESFGHHAEFPIGLYMDIPDNRGVYRRWMICSRDYELDYVKYSVLPCNYRFSWIIDDKTYQMWGIARLRNSYNSGIWKENITQTVENQDQMWLPINKYSKLIKYNQRLIVSEDLPEPITWKVSKLEALHPFGVFKITLAQDKFNATTDKFIDGFWYADYERQYIAKETAEDTTYEVTLAPSSGVYDIRVGEYTKRITCTIMDVKSGLDITNQDHSYLWTFTVNGIDISGELSPVINNNIVTLSLKNEDYIGETMVVSVSVDNKNSCSIELEVIA